MVGAYRNNLMTLALVIGQIMLLYININSNLPANCKMMSTVCDSCLNLVF